MAGLEQCSPTHALSKYNAERHQIIVEAVRKGNSRSNAFRLAGLHPDTVFPWLRWAREQPGTHPEYDQLLADIEFAESQVESERVALIKVAADTGTWQAAAWWLERRKPEDWGKRDHVQINAGDKPLIQLNTLILEKADVRELSRDFLRSITAGRPVEPIGLGMGDEPAEN